MLNKYNTKGKLVLFLSFTALSGALLLGFVLYQRHFDWPIDRVPFDNMRAQRRVLEFLDRAGWKPGSEKVIVERVGDDLGLARAVLLKKSNDGVSVPGVLFLVGRQYILVGRLFDSQTARDLSPDLFGRVPITFDVSRFDLNRAHKRGSTHPKVVIVEYGDYGCPGCAKLEKVWQALLDNFPDVEHVYKHFPLSEGSKYLAEVAEAVSLQNEAKFWEIHQRFMSADKNKWDESETKRFAQAQLKQSGLDPQQIEQTIRKGEPGKRVSRDQAEFPVSQTPTLIINGEVVVGAIEYGDLKRILREKLAPKGTPAISVTGDSLDANR
jgi:predicted DsbA family dithiol-disulfide isomerase